MGATRRLTTPFCLLLCVYCRYLGEEDPLRKRILDWRMEMGPFDIEFDISSQCITYVDSLYNALPNGNIPSRDLSFMSVRRFATAASELFATFGQDSPFENTGVIMMGYLCSTLH